MAEWISGVEYIKNITNVSVVSFGGSNYYPKITHTSSDDNKPPNTIYWQLFIETDVGGGSTGGIPINMDGGKPNSIYGGLDSIDGGGI